MEGDLPLRVMEGDLPLRIMEGDLTLNVMEGDFTITYYGRRLTITHYRRRLTITYDVEDIINGQEEEPGVLLPSSLQVVEKGLATVPQSSSHFLQNCLNVCKEPAFYAFIQLIYTYD